MADFLLELLSEEIPARMQAKARADLERLFVAQLSDAGLKAGDVTVYSTPRRLALIANDLPDQTEAVSEEAKGPPEGAPDQAVDGFCRKNGVTRDQLEVRDVKGRATYFAVINKPAKPTSEVLAIRLPLIVWDFPWPKSMRWGANSETTESLRWVRPLTSVVAILDDEPLEINFDVGHIYQDRKSGDIETREGPSGIVSSNQTVGHRFHHQGMITIGNAGDYAEKLRACHVLVDQAERETIVREGAAKAASDGGLELVADEGLVIENAGLTEWPVPLLGGFDPAFLDVPEEVIQLTARVNQKYFICRDKNGKLAPNFICTANIDASDGGKAIVAGNEKVLAARLSDAKFFWELDQKTALEDHAKKLSNIVFHEKLGTVADKVERVVKLAEWLASLEGTGLHRANPEQTQLAARLCKADLVTEMVGEFPELQGLMGGYYAEKEGLPEAVSNAVRDHYKPVGQGDDVPTDPVTVAVSLADKLDTLFSFFEIDEKPTGSKDPFALRRASLGILRLLQRNDIRVRMPLISDFWSGKPNAGLGIDIVNFFHDRLGVQLKESGIRYDVVLASAQLGDDWDSILVRVEQRAKALQAFLETEDGSNLLVGYKRASNILKKETTAGVDPEQSNSKTLSYTPEKAEKALIDALDAAQPNVTAAIAAEEFEKAMTALADLRAPIDQFFEDVTVNDSDSDKREARLALLARFRAAVHQVADFSKIEG